MGHKMANTCPPLHTTWRRQDLSLWTVLWSLRRLGTEHHVLESCGKDPHNELDYDQHLCVLSDLEEPWPAWPGHRVAEEWWLGWAWMNSHMTPCLSSPGLHNLRVFVPPWKEEGDPKVICIRYLKDFGEWVPGTRFDLTLGVGRHDYYSKHFTVLTMCQELLRELILTNKMNSYILHMQKLW